MKILVAALGVLVLMALQPASASVDRSADHATVTTVTTVATAPASGHPIMLAGHSIFTG